MKISWSCRENKTSRKHVTDELNNLAQLQGKIKKWIDRNILYESDIISLAETDVVKTPRTRSDHLQLPKLGTVPISPKATHHKYEQKKSAQGEED